MWAAFALQGTAHATSPAPSCADAGVSFEAASAEESEYAFDTPGHVVVADGVSWSGIEGHALALLGLEPGCFTGGVVAGPYDDASVYECHPTHCPSGGCPDPCLAYHETACIAPESAGGQVIEGLECTGYGDGVSREATSGDVVVRRAYLHDLKDDAVEDDFGLSNTRIFDSLFDGVHIAFGDRQRSSQNNDATATEWEVRDSLIRVRANQNPYKQQPGHGGIWKGDANALHQHRYRVTNNVFVAQGVKRGGLLFPVAGYVDECAGNVLLWAGPITGDGGWDEALEDQEHFADGLMEGERLAALEAAFPGCFSVVVKPEGQSEDEFLATPLPELGGKSWSQLVGEWHAGNAPPSVTIAAPQEGAIATAGEALAFTGSALDGEDGELSDAIAWSSSLAGPLGTGSLVVAGLPAGTHVVTASVIDSGGLPANATVTLTVFARVNIGCGIGPELALLLPLLSALRPRQRGAAERRAGARSQGRSSA